jgi:hypothetical protein
MGVRGEGARVAGRSFASLPSARSVRYAISLAGHVCVIFTFHWYRSKSFVTALAVLLLLP